MITYAGISPHPPLIIPEVGGDNIHQVNKTIQGLQALSAAVIDSSPEVIVFLTPHGNVFSDCISVLTEDTLQGNLGNFGRSDINLGPYRNDLDFVQRLGESAGKHGIHLLGVDQTLAHKHQLRTELDHGILVPLYYLEKTGLSDLPVIAISIGMLDNLELYRFGKLIQETAQRLNRRVAIIASGDMSHRLKEEGPYHYHPDGAIFDRTVKECIEKADAEGILNIPDSLRQNAGECGYPSIVIMLGALDGYAVKSHVFSYEGPFGVGYLTTGLQTGEKSDSVLTQWQLKQDAVIREKRAQESVPVRWARLNLEHHIKGQERPALEGDMTPLAKKRSAAFVSIKKNGQLRGCIGTFLPAYENLAEEIRHNALSAGLRDPRFAPVEASEMESLVYSVDLLSAPEPCQKEDLDTARYGVIVSHGNKRGLLLPDLEGIDTVETQLQIALQKADITAREDYTIQRFEVKRFV